MSVRIESESTAALTDAQVAKLEAAGFSRWQKAGHDRLYFDAYEWAWRNGIIVRGGEDHTLSIADEGRLINGKAWVDVRDGSVHAEIRNEMCYQWVLPRIFESVQAFIVA